MIIYIHYYPPYRPYNEPRTLSRQAMTGTVFSLWSFRARLTDPQNASELSMSFRQVANAWVEAKVFGSSMLVGGWIILFPSHASGDCYQLYRGRQVVVANSPRTKELIGKQEKSEIASFDAIVNREWLWQRGGAGFRSVADCFSASKRRFLRGALQ